MSPEPAILGLSGEFKRIGTAVPRSAVDRVLSPPNRAARRSMGVFASRIFLAVAVCSKTARAAAPLVGSASRLRAMALTASLSEKFLYNPLINPGRAAAIPRSTACLAAARSAASVTTNVPCLLKTSASPFRVVISTTCPASFLKKTPAPVPSACSAVSLATVFPKLASTAGVNDLASALRAIELPNASPKTLKLISAAISVAYSTVLALLRFARVA